MNDRGATISRRNFLALGGAALGLASASRRPLLRGPSPEPGRLATRFHKPVKQAPLSAGDHVLAADGDRRSILFVPQSYDAKRAAPFCLALHGATGSGDSMLRNTRDAAEKHGVIVLSPSSGDFSWDAIRGDYADDFARVDKLLGQVFDQCTIDPRRVAVAGFSDGATYALSIGLLNGDLFTHVIAHSPGFIIPGTPRGKPKVFISHGRQDTILPFESCGARIAKQLQGDGYRVRFDAFDGGHMATPKMREAAVAWFTA